MERMTGGGEEMVTPYESNLNKYKKIRAFANVVAHKQDEGLGFSRCYKSVGEVAEEIIGICREIFASNNLSLGYEENPTGYIVNYFILWRSDDVVIRDRLYRFDDPITKRVFMFAIIAERPTRHSGVDFYRPMASGTVPQFDWQIVSASSPSWFAEYRFCYLTTNMTKLPAGDELSEYLEDQKTKVVFNGSELLNFMLKEKQAPVKQRLGRLWNGEDDGWR